MAVIGSIAVNVLANITGFSSKMKEGERSVTRFSITSTRAIGMVRNAVAGLVTGVAVGAFINTLRQTADEMDKIAKTSSKLGVATENLIALRHAASQTGVADNTLDMALQRMTRRVAEAAKDTGEAKDALKELGLSAVQLNALSPDKQFAKIADEMAKVKDRTHQVRLAFKLFDSEGVSLVNTLDLGASGLAKMKKEAQEMGILFSAAEAKKIEKFNDEMDKLSKVWKGFTQDLVIRVAPEATKFVEGLRRVADADDRYFGNSGMRGLKRIGGASGDFVGSFFGQEAKRNAIGNDDASIKRIENVMRKNFESLGTVDTEHIRKAEQMRFAAEGNRIKQDQESAKRFLAEVRGITKATQAQDIALKVGEGIHKAFAIMNTEAGENGLFGRRFVKPLGRVLGQGAVELARNVVPEDRREFHGTNRAVRADTAEGFMALRRNMQPGMDTAKDQLKETKQQTKLQERISTLLENTLEVVGIN